MRRVDIKTVSRAWWWAAGAIVSLFMTPAYAQIDLGRLLRESMANGARASAVNPRARAEADRAGADEWCIKLGQWLNKTDTVPPEILQLHLGGRGRDRSPGNAAGLSDAAKIPRQAWILDDLRFVPEFGKPFDSVTPQEAARFQQQAGLCRTSAGVRDVNPKLLDANGFGQVFNGPTQGQMALGVQAIRAARAEVQSVVQRFQALPIGEQGVIEYRQLEPQAKRLKLFLGTAERAGLDEALAAAQSRIEASLAADVQALEDRLAMTPATQEGARTLVEWETAFNQRFGDFGSAPSVQHARQTLADTRAKLMLALLPAWQAQVAKMPGTPTEVAARRAEMSAMFGPADDKRTPLFAEFKAPVDAREQDLLQQFAAEDQARLQQAQRAAVLAAAGPGGEAVLKASDLKRPGTAGGKLLGALFQGEFDPIEVEPGGWEMSALVGGYINAFSDQCRAQIADPVELTRMVCDAERVTTRNGLEVSRDCVRSHQEGTGVFAERSLHEATKARAPEQMAGTVRMAFDMANSRDFALNIANSRNLLEQGSARLAAAKDMQEASAETVRTNGCKSPSLKRLRVNLENFLRGGPGIQLNGTTAIGVAMLPAAPGQAYRDANYERLLGDMVRASAANWAFNRYVFNSISSVRVHARDPGGRPLRVEANYRFVGMQGEQQGHVALEFNEGRPRCLFFSDAQADCRVPQRWIVTDYVNGKYR